MPQVTIYIRNEDYDKWKAIENKPEWLHHAIASTIVIDGEQHLDWGAIDKTRLEAVKPTLSPPNPIDEILPPRMREYQVTPPEDVA